MAKTSVAELPQTPLSDSVALLVMALQAEVIGVGAVAVCLGVLTFPDDEQDAMTMVK